jgi:hypothetical protein
LVVRCGSAVDSITRLEEEYNLLLKRFPKAQYHADGRWFLVPDYPLPEGWGLDTITLVFQLPDGYPQTLPYGFYVPSGLRFRGNLPGNFTDLAGAVPPVGTGSWGFFSGNPETWAPSTTVSEGSNVVAWIHAIGERLKEGV